MQRISTPRRRVRPGGRGRDGRANLRADRPLRLVHGLGRAPGQRQRADRLVGRHQRDLLRDGRQRSDAVDPDRQRWHAGGDTPSAYISYRAALVPERDGFDPEVTLDGPADGVTVAQGADVPVEFSCWDRGGSTLQTCDGPSGGVLDTDGPGTHTWQVVARDGSGGGRTITRSYTVTPRAPDPTPTTDPTPTPTPMPAPVPAPTPTAARSPGPGGQHGPGSWVGAGTYAPSPRLRSSAPGRVVPCAPCGSGSPTPAARAAGSCCAARRRPALAAARSPTGSRGQDRTGAVSRGWRMPALDPGASLRVRMRVRSPARFAGTTLPSASPRPAVRDRVAWPCGADRDVTCAAPGVLNPARHHPGVSNVARHLSS